MSPFYFRVGDGLSLSGEGAEAVYRQEVKLHSPGFVNDKHLKDKVLKLVHELLQALERSPFTVDFKEETIKHQGITFKVTCFLDKVRMHSHLYACMCQRCLWGSTLLVFYCGTPYRRPFR